MLYWIQWINTTSKLQVSTGIFYLLISRNILNRNFIWKKHHVNHPTLSEPCFFHISVTSLCNSLCSLSWHLCTFVLHRRILTTTHTFVVSFLCLFFSCLFSVSLHVSFLSQLLLQRVLVPKVGIASPKHSASHKRCINV